MPTLTRSAPGVDAVVKIQSRLKLGDAEVADTLGVDQSTYYRWREHQSSPGPMARSRIAQLQDVMELMRGLFPGADLARKWLRTAKPEMLGGDATPIAVMRQGRIDRVLTVLTFVARGA